MYPTGVEAYVPRPDAALIPRASEAMRRLIARSLERGKFSGPGVHELERVWRAWSASRVVRRLDLPEDVVVIAIGGATLGGSGKTPLALACARFAAECDAGDVALIGHAYRASPERARVVAPDDACRVVGDEALLCARQFMHDTSNPDARIEVIVAPSRQGAVDFAVARGARILVLDGVAQIAPRRAGLALLALDGTSPWGNEACPPRGDLRAPVPALLAACDRTVMLSGDSVQSRGAVAERSGVHTQRKRVSYDELAHMRVGLFTALARPDRVVASLKAYGVLPRARIHASDHGTPSGRELARSTAAHGLDCWVTTSKCAIHLPNSLSVPVYVLEHHVVLEPSLRDGLASVLGGRSAARVCARPR
ncbi:MAG TPA: tetraacyldisaccharide 4'-kinase [Polyangiaceae bacterium]|nr:tetraacyldisaccharide 4'-kinase [Polyangiaceae bacterium]